MKHFATLIVGLALALSAMAEASFDQIEHLIEQRNYAAAASGLEVIIQNHPKSAKAFYAMAQAQAGLGNLEKANKALNIATGLNPTLDFAPQSSVQSLKDAITPQVSKIEAVEESHFWRNTFLILLVLGAGIGGMIYAAKRKEDEETVKREEAARREALEEYNRQVRERESKVAKANAAPINQTPATASIATSGPAVPQPLYTPQPTHTTVVNNTSSNDGFLTGMLVGDMLSHHNHDTTRVVEREVIREVPAPTYTPSPTQSVRDSSWDDTPSTPSRSSSWDDSSSSSSSSSSWSSSSSSDSSSSWDSGSSSSDSGSSSSWD